MRNQRQTAYKTGMVKKLRKNAKDISQKGSANGKGTKKIRPVAGPILFAGTVFEATYVV